MRVTCHGCVWRSRSSTSKCVYLAQFLSRSFFLYSINSFSLHRPPHLVSFSSPNNSFVGCLSSSLLYHCHNRQQKQQKPLSYCQRDHPNPGSRSALCRDIRCTVVHGDLPKDSWACGCGPWVRPCVHLALRALYLDLKDGPPSRRNPRMESLRVVARSNGFAAYR
jgi:hypothetical protein